jgi:Lrp/AsnC family transcriptional regulator, leucine-responsive regulatory protein
LISFGTPIFILFSRPAVDVAALQDNRRIEQSACGISDKAGVLWHFLRLRPPMTQVSAMQLDRFDKKILAALQKDGRISNVELASRVSLSESACLRRVRALEQAGLIERYVALLDQKKAGLAGNVFVHIALNREEQSELAAFEAAVQNLPEVMECYLMTGEFDYLLRVVVSDMADFERVHNEALTRLPGVARVNSSVAIRTVRKTTELPMP